MTATDPITPTEEYTRAVTARARGDTAAAAAGLRRVLAADPRHVGALHQLAILALGESRPTEALVLAERALAIDPDAPDLHDARGVALAALGRFSDAAASFRAAVARQHDPPITLLSNLALCLMRAQRPDEAIPVLRQVLALAPDTVDAMTNLGGVLGLKGETAEADSLLTRAVQRAPANAAALNNLAMVREKQGRPHDAATLARRALAVNPAMAEAHFTLAAALSEQGAIDAAIAAYGRSIELAPTRVEAHINLAAALQERGDTAGALAATEQAIALKPDHGDAHFNCAMLLFALGRFDQAWAAYDWRWRTPAVPARWRDFPQPRWRGEPLPAGRKLLVWAEQGVGDEILYATLLPDLIARGFNLVFECDPRLVTLFARSFPGVTVAARRDPPDAATQDPTIAAQTPAADVGRHLRRRAADFKPVRRLLQADPQRQAACRRALDGDGVVVGLSWLSRNARFRARKSTRLADWSNLLARPGLRWVDLQYGETADDRATLDPAVRARLTRLPGLDLTNDLDGVAAAAAACDVVVTVCNTTAHIAAALGVPTWVLVPHARGRLWWTFTAGSASPWYASVRFFRQGQDGDWTGPLADIAAALDQLCLTKLGN
ncbi:MAG: tetratricopeptide repeat protein [Rhodospirillaceae bacterium]|nr:tetratricopeptide repeat protein [Rhodospirillaceae bacterium]